MTGQSAALSLPEPVLDSDSGTIDVRTSAGTLRIANFRTPGAGKARLERLERSFGGIVAELAEQAETFAVPFRAELRDLAGLNDTQELPISVQVATQLAVMAVTNVRKAELLANAAFGDWSEARLDTLACETLHERADKSQRNLAGLAIVARDLLLAARAAAKELRAGQGSATDGLMSALGVTRKSVDAQGSPPVAPPGGCELGAPISLNPDPTSGSK